GRRIVRIERRIEQTERGLAAGRGELDALDLADAAGKLLILENLGRFFQNDQLAGGEIETDNAGGMSRRTGAKDDAITSRADRAEFRERRIDWPQATADQIKHGQMAEPRL